MRQRFRAAFDPARVFIALRPLSLEGEAVPRGAAFPRDKVTMTRLRQLFDQRALGYGDEDPKSRYLPVNPDRPRVDGQVAAPYPPAIPENWRDLPFAAKQKLAAVFARVFPRAMIEVDDAIEAEVARRARATR